MPSANSYESAIAFLSGGRNKTSRPIENNTRIEKRGEDYAVVLHSTDVVTYHEDGSVTLNSGGWFTITTKDRINRHMGIPGIRVYSDLGRWFIYSRGEKICRFFDGITITKSGTILNPRSESLEERLTLAEEKMRQSITRYIDGYFEAMEAGKMPLPSGGDCWDCSMIVSDGPDKGKPIGDVKDGDHLLSHIKDRYYVPSLLWNAVGARGYRNISLIMSTRLDREAWENEGLMKVRRAWQSDQPDGNSIKELRLNLRKYLAKRLIKTRAH